MKAKVRIAVARPPNSQSTRWARPTGLAPPRRIGSPPRAHTTAARSAGSSCRDPYRRPGTPPDHSAPETPASSSRSSDMDATYRRTHAVDPTEAWPRAHRRGPIADPPIRLHPFPRRVDLSQPAESSQHPGPFAAPPAVRSRPPDPLAQRPRRWRCLGERCVPTTARFGPAGSEAAQAGAGHHQTMAGLRWRSAIGTAQDY